jgi:hypothetical protein
VTRFPGFPIGAPVQAGFLVTGLREQAGVLVLFGVSRLVFRRFGPMVRLASLAFVGLAAAVAFTNIGAATTISFGVVAVAAVSTNPGEATILSFGGTGLFVWLMIGWARILAVGT